MRSQVIQQIVMDKSQKVFFTKGFTIYNVFITINYIHIHERKINYEKA